MNLSRLSPLYFRLQLVGMPLVARSVHALRFRSCSFLLSDCSRQRLHRNRTTEFESGLFVLGKLLKAVTRIPTQIRPINRVNS